LEVVLIRRLAASVIATAMLVIWTNGPVSAASGSGLEDFSQMYSTFSYVDPLGRQSSGIWFFEIDNLTGAQYASVFIRSIGGQVICDAGTPDDPTDDFSATERFGWDMDTVLSETVSISSPIDEVSATGHTEVVIDGTRHRIDACSGEFVDPQPERHAFELDLVSSSAPMRSTSSQTFVTEDGTRVVYVQRAIVRSAVGSARIDDSLVTVADGQLSHLDSNYVTH
jgi:hypothetical protein